MHLDVLNQDQRTLLPMLAKFNREFYMVGGTALTLHIGHRLSIDFDMFKKGVIKPKSILNKFDTANEKYKITLNVQGQLNLSCREVKFTFFDYEFEIPHPVNVENSIYVQSLIDLAAMKAYALGHRSKWKDYLDLYFIIKGHFPIAVICEHATKIYGDLFSAKLFCGQLNYFAGINHTEAIELMPGFEADEKTVKTFLTHAALSEF